MTTIVIVINFKISNVYRIDENVESATKNDGSSESTTMIKTYKYDVLLTNNK